MDRRPQQPRQLAGEYGSSADGDESFDAGALAAARFFDPAADAVRACKSLDDPVNADRPAADVTFKPKCLGIESSIQIFFRTRACDSIKALGSIPHKHGENRMTPVFSFASSIALPGARRRLRICMSSEPRCDPGPVGKPQPTTPALGRNRGIIPVGSPTPRLASVLAARNGVCRMRMGLSQ
jgi:hypothetical protein